MVKTYHIIQQWDRWLASFRGQSVLEAETMFFPSLLTQYYGAQALLIGTPRQHVLLKSSVIPNQSLLSPLLSHHHPKNIRSIESELHELPIASGSIDLLLLPHVLEYLDNPRQLLAEACRVIKPQGHIVICGFNPYSMWGLKKMTSQHKNIPWSGNFIRPTLIGQWLTLADFELIKKTKIFFRPPPASRSMHEKLAFLEKIGKKCYQPLGGIYVVVAQAKVIPLTPIRMCWKQPFSVVHFPSAVRVPKPTAPS